MDWQTLITFVILVAAGGNILKRLAAFTRFGKAGSCGACIGCGQSPKNKVPAHLVQLATGQDQRTGSHSVRAYSGGLHREFSGNVAAGAEKNR